MFSVLPSGLFTNFRDNGVPVEAYFWVGRSINYFVLGYEYNFVFY